MNPIYKFQLSVGTDEQQAFPIYGGDLSKDFEKVSNQEFFRAKLSGKLTFQNEDYDRIVSAAFDTQFILEVLISYNAGLTWTTYWNGTFWKTDCDFDEDAKTVQVTPTVNDQYNDVLAGLEKEYNLIDLLPEIVPVKADKRPMIQAYVPGQTVIGCFLSGMWWEQECESVLTTDTVKIIVDGQGVEVNKLQNYLHFTRSTSVREITISQTGSPTLPDSFVGSTPISSYVDYEITNGAYKFKQTYSATATEEGVWHFEIIRISDNITMWSLYLNNVGPLVLPIAVTLQPVSGTGATGTVVAYLRDIAVFTRCVLDADTILGLQTYELPADDIVENNRNYHRVIGYGFADTVYFSGRFSSTPTKWGLYQPGQYYEPPYLYWNPPIFPIARNSWGRLSVWFTASAAYELIEEDGRQTFTLRDAFPLASVISVLLNKIAPGITHAETTAYSQFLYGDNNPITAIAQRILLTPKSNVISAGYDQPAQKAPITLKAITDMLRDCFRCYWFIDSDNRLRIEHISYFMNGGSYSGSPVVGVDLTAQKVTRNNKAWAFARNQYQFDKPEMAARYQFGWMDDVTQLFEGYPIDIISKYVNPDNIEEISVSRFTSDIDYILLNPGAISKDGFVLLAATLQSDSRTESNTVTATPLQNYLNTIEINIPAGAYYTVRAVGPDGVIYGNAFFVYRNGVQTTDVARLNTPVTFTAAQNITSVGIGIGGGAIDTEGAITLYIDVSSGESYKLPYYDFGNGQILQNAYLAFIYLQRYYAYDMPARAYQINGQTYYASGVKKLKKQTLRFPVLADPNLMQLIKTQLGDGEIEKLSVNLSSRSANVTLKYDTE